MTNGEPEIIESRGVRVPFDPEIITPVIERPLRRGRYELGELLAIRGSVRQGDRVLELGTGIGMVSTLAAQVVGVERVVSYEANPRLLPFIGEVHRLNDVVEKVEVRNALVTRGNAPPTLPFHLRGDFWASSLSAGPQPFNEIIDVPTEDFDKVLLDFQPTVILADIEGAELDLFEGASLRGVRCVTVEIHPRIYGAGGVKRFFDTMSQHGYAYWPKVSRGGTVITFVHVRRRSRQSVSSFIPDAATPAISTAQTAASTQPAGPSVLVTSCMKNEGPFVLDWLAHHRAVGIRDFVIFTNDCTDGTDALLAHLDRRGIVRHLPNPSFLSRDPVAFQPAALAYTRAMLPTSGADYVLSMDVDEYVNVQVGGGTLADLFAEVGEVDALSMSELNFGADGMEHFEDVPVTERFRRAETMRPGDMKARRGVKTLVRVGSALSLRNHRPLLAANARDAQIDWRDGSGREVPPEFVTERANGIDCRGRYDLVLLNHYSTRDMESFLVKRDRGDVVHEGHQVGPRYWRQRNVGATEDQSIDRIAAARAAERDFLRSDPETVRLHDAAVAAHRARIAELRADPDYAAFLDRMRSAVA